MPTSDASETPPPHSEPIITVALTALLASLLLGVALFVPLDTRNARGQHREMSAFDVWRKMLTNLPSDAPFFLNTWTLSVLSILALITSAYVIVAIARLPR